MDQGDGRPEYGAQAWGPPQAPLSYGYPKQGPSALAIASLVVSIVALIGVLIVAAWLFLSGAPLPGDSGAQPLTGKVPSASANGPLAGDDLSGLVTDLITDDGGDVSEMRCPSTPTLDQGVVTVCHGVISDEDWAVVVYFEDAAGRFTIQPI